MPEDVVERKSFIIASIDSWIVYQNKHYQQVHLKKCANKIVSTEMVVFEFNEFYEFCVTIELKK